MASVVYDLAIYPEIQDKVREEIEESGISEVSSLFRNSLVLVAFQEYYTVPDECLYELIKLFSGTFL